MKRACMNPVATNQANYPAIAIAYEIDVNGQYIIAQIGDIRYHSAEYVENKPIRCYKAYYSKSRDDRYIRKDKINYYFNEFRTITPQGGK